MDLPFLLLLFFASGLAALLYQTIWQHGLGFLPGVDVYSVTSTVAAFMTGLRWGSLLVGHLTGRLSSRHRRLAFVERITRLDLNSNLFPRDGFMIP